VKQAERDTGKRIDRPTSAELDELGRIRRENHRLRPERDILAKAAAWFARESKASPIHLSRPSALAAKKPAFVHRQTRSATPPANRRDDCRDK